MIEIYENLTIFSKMLEISGLFFYMELFEKLRLFWKLFFIYENRFKVMKTSEYFWNVLNCCLIRVEVVNIYENVTTIFRKFSKFWMDGWMVVGTSAAKLLNF